MKIRRVSDFSLYLIDHSQTLYECLVKFEENKCHTLLIQKDKKIIGTVTDGDIRKALIKFRTLQTKVNLVMNTNYISCHSKSGCEDFFQKYPYLTLLPVINDERELLSIFLRF